MTSEQQRQRQRRLAALGGPVAVLLGGVSAEREISLKSGEAVARALESLGIAVQCIDTAHADWLQRVASSPLAFVALHGPGGEDGCAQGALEVLGVPYTGSGVLASALAMDKWRCKQLWRGIGLPTPEFEQLDANSDWAAISARLGPAIVKPSLEGSSLGMARADSAEELAAAYRLAADYGAVFAERWITGEEYTVAVLGRETLPPIRLETDRGFYDYEAKYQSATTRYICPCGLDPAQQRALTELALTAFDSLGCRGWGRVDVMRDAEGAFHLLEINTIPGMTDHSLVPMAAAARDMDFQQLVAAIAETALEVER